MSPAIRARQPVVRLRDVTAADLAIFFEHQRDPAARWMAAFTARDPTDHAAFMAHWAKLQADPTVHVRAVLADAAVAGHIVRFLFDAEPNVGYWLGRQFWGGGIATRALQLFLTELPERPLYAGVAADNHGSRRVLEKCGFCVAGETRSYSNARGADVSELHLVLE